jgi:hypothetical protein
MALPRRISQSIRPLQDFTSESEGGVPKCHLRIGIEDLFSECQTVQYCHEERNGRGVHRILCRLQGIVTPETGCSRANGLMRFRKLILVLKWKKYLANTNKTLITAG